MTARVIHSPVSPGPRSPRAKSFAQHLLEIEQEAARAASRCRSSHTRASLAFGDAPPSPGALPPPSTGAGGAAFSSPSRTPTARAMDAVTPAAASAAAAELARRRAEVEVHVLRRALPELEEALDAQSGLLQASLAQQQTLARVRIQQDAALREAKATNQHLTAEVAGLRAQNDALERQAHAQAAELARLREGLGAGGGAGADYTSPEAGGGRPSLDPPPHTPITPARRPQPLAPLSPLLEGLDEAAPRSRAQAYWRRAQMSLRIASIADFWQARNAAAAAARAIRRAIL